MYTLKTEHCFDAAHFLSGYDGKCKNIHGHRWRVIIEVQSAVLNTDKQTRGMVVDFGRLKNDLRLKTEKFDHSLIIEKNSLRAETMLAFAAEDFKITEVDFRPTAECFAKYFYDVFTDMGYDVSLATVYETQNNCASYSGKE